MFNHQINNMGKIVNNSDFMNQMVGELQNQPENLASLQNFVKESQPEFVNSNECAIDPNLQNLNQNQLNHNINNNQKVYSQNQN